MYFFYTDLTILVYDKLVSKMGKPKKSVVWEFFEQRVDGKGFVSSWILTDPSMKIIWKFK